MEMIKGSQQKSTRTTYYTESDGTNMKIAATYENTEIFQHFGQSKRFKVYEIADGKIVKTSIIDTLGSGHGTLAGFLKQLNVDTLLCGGIGDGAKQTLAEAGIRLCAGASGDADKAVLALLSGELIFSPDATCDHHGENHADHDCANHE